MQLPQSALVPTTASARRCEIGELLLGQVAVGAAELTDHVDEADAGESVGELAARFGERLEALLLAVPVQRDRRAVERGRARCRVVAVGIAAVCDLGAATGLTIVSGTADDTAPLGALGASCSVAVISGDLDVDVDVGTAAGDGLAQHRLQLGAGQHALVAGAVGVGARPVAETDRAPRRRRPA